MPPQRLRRLSAAVREVRAHTYGAMCTRDWQRSTALEQPASAATPWPSLDYVTVLEADGSFGRRFAGCTCGGAPSEHRTRVAPDHAPRQHRAPTGAVTLTRPGTPRLAW